MEAKRTAKPSKKQEEGASSAKGKKKKWYFTAWLILLINLKLNNKFNMIKTALVAILAGLFAAFVPLTTAAYLIDYRPLSNDIISLQIKAEADSGYKT